MLTCFTVLFLQDDSSSSSDASSSASELSASDCEEPSMLHLKRSRLSPVPGSSLSSARRYKFNKTARPGMYHRMPVALAASLAQGPHSISPTMHSHIYGHPSSYCTDGAPSPLGASPLGGSPSPYNMIPVMRSK